MPFVFCLHVLTILFAMFIVFCLIFQRFHTFLTVYFTLFSIAFSRATFFGISIFLQVDCRLPLYLRNIGFALKSVVRFQISCSFLF